jgi:hypothetical protein
VFHSWLTGGQAPAAGNTATRVLAACLATVPEVAFILPLEVAKLTLQLDTNGAFANSAGRVLAHLWRRHGAAALYLGWLAVQLRQAIWGAVYFASVAAFTAQCTGWVALLAGAPPLPGSWGAAVASLFGGFLAGVLGVCFNNPFDVGRTVLQTEALRSLAFGEDARAAVAGPPGSSALRVTLEVARRRGLHALWAGFAFKAAHLGGSGALMNVLLPAFSRLCGLAEE